MAVCRWLWIIQPFTNWICFPFFFNSKCNIFISSFHLLYRVHYSLLQCNCTNLPLINVFYSILFYKHFSDAERARRSGGAHTGSPGVALHVRVCLHAGNRKSAAKWEDFPPSLFPYLLLPLFLHTEPSAVWLPRGSSSFGAEPPCTQLMDIVKRLPAPPTVFCTWIIHRSAAKQRQSRQLILSFILRSSSCSSGCTTQWTQSDTFHTVFLGETDNARRI